MTDILSMINRLQDTAIDFTLSGRERDRDELHAARRAIMEAFAGEPAAWRYLSSAKNAKWTVQKNYPAQIAQWSGYVIEPLYARTAIRSIEQE